MAIARQKILDHIKKVRSASAREIARALKMSAPNVRHHLSVLCKDGRVEMTSTKSRGQKGRPEKTYSLGNKLIGDNLEILADTLLNEIVDTTKLGKQIVKLQNLKLTKIQPLALALSQFIEKMNEMHYQAHWEAGAEGPRVGFGRCPYSKLIANHPELCDMDTSLMEESLSQTVLRVEKNEKSKPGFCPFIFILKG